MKRKILIVLVVIISIITGITVYKNSVENFSVNQDSKIIKRINASDTKLIIENKPEGNSKNLITSRKDAVQNDLGEVIDEKKISNIKPEVHVQIKSINK